MADTVTLLVAPLPAAAAVAAELGGSSGSSSSSHQTPPPPGHWPFGTTSKLRLSAKDTYNDIARKLRGRFDEADSPDSSVNPSLVYLDARGRPVTVLDDDSLFILVSDALKILDAARASGMDELMCLMLPAQRGASPALGKSDLDRATELLRWERSGWAAAGSAAAAPAAFPLQQQPDAASALASLSAASYARQSPPNPPAADLPPLRGSQSPANSASNDPLASTVAPSPVNDAMPLPALERNSFGLTRTGTDGSGSGGMESNLVAAAVVAAAAVNSGAHDSPILPSPSVLFSELQPSMKRGPPGSITLPTLGPPIPTVSTPGGSYQFPTTPYSPAPGPLGMGTYDMPKGGASHAGNTGGYFSSAYSQQYNPAMMGPGHGYKAQDTPSTESPPSGGYQQQQQHQPDPNVGAPYQYQQPPPPHQQQQQQQPAAGYHEFNYYPDSAYHSSTHTTYHSGSGTGSLVVDTSGMLDAKASRSPSELAAGVLFEAAQMPRYQGSVPQAPLPHQQQQQQPPAPPTPQQPFSAVAQEPMDDISGRAVGYEGYPQVPWPDYSKMTEEAAREHHANYANWYHNWFMSQSAAQGGKAGFYPGWPAPEVAAAYGHVQEQSGRGVSPGAGTGPGAVAASGTPGSGAATTRRPRASKPRASTSDSPNSPEGSPGPNATGGSGAFSCDRCGKRFTRRFNLHSHKLSHDGERPFTCDHPGCGKSFARKHDLKRHMKLHGEKEYVCMRCGGRFARGDAMERHKRSSCRGPEGGVPGAGRTGKRKRGGIKAEADPDGEGSGSEEEDEEMMEGEEEEEYEN